MRKTTLLMFTLALLGTVADAAAQDARKAAPRPGYIGVRFQEQHQFITGSVEANKSTVTVEDVSKDSPAEKAGLRAGDEIIRINGMSVANGKFSAVARTLTEGDTVRLRVKRAEQERDYTLIAAPRPNSHSGLLGDRTYVFSADSVRGLMRMYLDSARVHLDSMKLPRVWVHPGDSSFDIRIERFRGMPGDTLIFRRDTAAVRLFRDKLHGAAPEEIFRRFEDLGPGVVFRSMELGGRSIAGAEFTDLDPGMKTYFGTDRGLLTLRVAPETPAARAGLRAGDIVVKANNQTVERVADLRGLLFSQPETLKIEVLRKGETKTLEIQTRRKGSED